jgi:hypothetical protein
VEYLKISNGGQLSPCVELFIELLLHGDPEANRTMSPWFSGRRGCNGSSGPEFLPAEISGEGK